MTRQSYNIEVPGSLLGYCVYSGRTMGKAAADWSDFAVVTTDNPRTEEPAAIIRDILPGMAGAAGRYAVEPDRRKAIALAMEQGRAGDVILLCGKGHETYQEIGNETYPMDEREIVRSLL